MPLTAYKIRFSLLLAINAVIGTLIECRSVDISGKNFKYAKTEDESGNYHFEFVDESDLESNRTETGTVAKSAEGVDTLKVEGSYAYNYGLSHLCLVIHIKYVADENGYRARISYEVPTENGKPVCPIMRTSEQARGICTSALCTLQAPG